MRTCVETQTKKQEKAQRMLTMVRKPVELINLRFPMVGHWRNQHLGHGSPREPQESSRMQLPVSMWLQRRGWAIAEALWAGLFTTSSYEALHQLYTCGPLLSSKFRGSEKSFSNFGIHLEPDWFQAAGLPTFCCVLFESCRLSDASYASSDIRQGHFFLGRRQSGDSFRMLDTKGDTCLHGA